MKLRNFDWVGDILIRLLNTEENLSHIEGDIRTVAREDLRETEHLDTNVIVPLNENETGFFQGLLNTIGLGDDEQEIRSAEEQTEIEKTSPDEEAELTEEVK